MNKTKGIRKPAQATETAQTGNNYILAIGINDYDHCPKLDNAVKDVADFTQLMIGQYGFDPQHVTLITDKEATYKRIFSELKRLVTLVKPNDNVLIYFSGHGEMDEVLDEGYWIPVEAKHGFENQYIANSTIQKILNKVKSFHTFLIVDSCYSGSLFLDGKTRFISDAYDFPSRWGLTSGRNTIVSDGKAGENSPFAKALLETLRYTHEPINSSALCDVIKQNVAATTGKNQLPVGDPLSINGHKGGQFVFHPIVKTPQIAEDIAAFQSATTVEEILTFMRNFPDSDLRQAALIRLETVLATPKVSPPVATVEPEKVVQEIVKESPIAIEAPIIAVKEPIIAVYTTVQTEVETVLTPSVQTDFDFEPAMVFVEGGTFLMGSSNGQAREKPIHEVTLDAFYLGKYPVTQREWLAVMSDNPSHFKNNDNRPVENLCWDDAQEYIAALNAKTGKKYRLPTEAEWEYAARGGNQSKGFKYAGSDILSEVAWFDKNAGNKTHPVGEKKPNELGLYDMCGNVWEWCNDVYGDYPTEAVTNPKGASTGSYHVNRGGSFNFAASYARPKYRCYDPANNIFNGLGFRIAMSVEE